VWLLVFGWNPHFDFCAVMFTFIIVHLDIAIVDSDACTVWQTGRPNILAARIPFDAAVVIIVFLLFCFELQSISFNSWINKLSLITAESAMFCRCAAKNRSLSRARGSSFAIWISCSFVLFTISMMCSDLLPFILDSWRWLMSKAVIFVDSSASS